MFQPNQSDSAAPAAQRTKRQHLKDNTSECLDQAEKPWKEYSMVSILYMICHIQFWILSKSHNWSSCQKYAKWPAHSHTTSWHLQCYLVDLFFMCIPAYPPFLPSITWLIHIQKSMDDSGSLVVSGLYSKKPYPPGFWPTNLKKNHPVCSKKHQPNAERRKKRTFDSCLCAALRLAPWIEGSKASSLQGEMVIPPRIPRCFF